jgi:hypothetical protein
LASCGIKYAERGSPGDKTRACVIEGNTCKVIPQFWE